jgi:hypothetical protein
MADQRTSFADAYSAFVENGGERAAGIYREWEMRADLRAAGVIDFVKGFTHERLYRIDRDELNRVVAQTKHPLRDIWPRKRKRDQEAVDLVADADVPWSFMQVFHMYLEAHGLPTWQAFRSFLAGDGIEYIWGPYKRQLNFDADPEDVEHRSLVSDGTAWRLGNMYYSALREIDILVSLREKGIMANYHVLPDALFAADFWCGNRIASVYIQNPDFKSVDGSGRKGRPQEIFRDTRFTCRDFAIIKQKVAGHYWPVSSATVDKIAGFFGT